MSQVLDDSTAILWGSADHSLTWVVLSRKHGKTVVARTTRDQLTVRDFGNVPADMDAIAHRALQAWGLLREGKGLAHWATHELQPPHHQNIVPLERQP